MIDVKAIREEMSKLHAEASAQVSKYAAEDAGSPSEEEAKAQEERFAKLDAMQVRLDAAEKLAKYSFERGEPTVQGERKSEAHKAVERFEREQDAPAALDFAAYDRAISAFVQKRNPEEYATITSVTTNGVMLPKVVTKPLTPTRTNVYRAAMAALGMEPESLGNTSDASVPVISSTSGGPIGEDANVNTDANPVVQAIKLTPAGYQSGTYWYSKLVVNAVDWSVSQSTLPALLSAKDYGFAKGITNAIIADASITNVVPTASASTITLDNLDDLNQALPMVYDTNKVIILSREAYNTAEKLKDDTGNPILSRNAVQEKPFLMFKGTLVMKDDTLDGFGAAKTVGLVISFDGFKLRDESQELETYDHDPDRPGKLGLNAIGYHAAGWVPGAVAKLRTA